MPKQDIVPLATIEQRILVIRGQRVILDTDLAELYGVQTRVLNQAVRRNIGRFPDDFMFQLTSEEHADLKSQFVTSSSTHGGRRKRPFAFTEHGAIMAANVLNSEQAVKVGVFVVRAFVKLREVLATHRQLAGKLDELEQKLQQHDHQIIALIDAIRELMAEPPEKRKKPIGFTTEERGRKAKSRQR